MAKTKNISENWVYNPAPESSDHIRLAKQYQLYINGEWVKPNSGKYFDTINPANGKKLASVAHANESDVDKAVKAARNAYNSVWSKMPAAERGKYI